MQEGLVPIVESQSSVKCAKLAVWWMGGRGDSPGDFQLQRQCDLTPGAGRVAGKRVCL